MVCTRVTRNAHLFAPIPVLKRGAAVGPFAVATAYGQRPLAVVLHNTLPLLQRATLPGVAYRYGCGAAPPVCLTTAHAYRFRLPSARLDACSTTHFTVVPLFDGCDSSILLNSANWIQWTWVCCGRGSLLPFHSSPSPLCRAPARALLLPLDGFFILRPMPRYPPQALHYSRDTFHYLTANILRYAPIRLVPLLRITFYTPVPSRTYHPPVTDATRHTRLTRPADILLFL